MSDESTLNANLYTNERTLGEKLGWWFRKSIYNFRANPLLYIGATIFALLILVAIFAPWLAPYEPLKMNFAHKLQSPNSEHWFGTDNLGRDIFSQVLYGARTSLSVGVITVVLSLLIGLPIGLVAGYAGAESIVS